MYYYRIFHKEYQARMVKNIQEFLQTQERSGEIAIAGTGVSGILALGVLATVFPNPIVVVRKPGESSHSKYLVEGNNTSVLEKIRWIFVDDFIDTGATLRRVSAEIALAFKTRTPELVGAYLYLDARFINTGAIRQIIKGEG